MNDILKFVIGTIIILSVGITLAIIGIQHEHLTKLRDRKAELEIMLKDSEDKIKGLQKELKDTKEDNKELEKELCKYDKKRRKEATKLLEKITDGVISKATLHKTILLDDKEERKE